MKRLGPSRTASKFEARTASVRYWIRSSGVEVRLEQGETLIGRADHCHVRIPDPVVSREHARLVLRGGELIIEDLDSAHGVYVNDRGVRLSKRLRTGDRITIGPCELVVHAESGEGDRPTHPNAARLSRSTDRLKPRGSLTAVLERPGGSQKAGGSASSEESQQADTLEYVGRMVDKMFAAGRIEAAQRLLSSHLQEVLNAARGGRPVEPRLADVAGRCAVRLANETLDSRWIDLCVELHILADRLMAKETVENLVALREKAPLGSRALLRQYEQLLRAKVDGMDPGDRALVARIACL